jgi:hypothetical protein
LLRSQRENPVGGFAAFYYYSNGANPIDTIL